MLPTATIIELDVADAGYLASNGVLDDVILHEMGHCLGLGVLWNTVRYGFPGTQKVYTQNSGVYGGGASGNAAYAREIQVGLRT